MKVGTEDKKKLILAGVFGFVAIFALYYGYSSIFGGTPAPPAQAPVIVDMTPKAMGGSSARASASVGSAPSATKVGTISGKLDPTLHMGAMRAAESLVYTGTGRNIFAAGPTPDDLAKLAQAKFAARPNSGPTGPQKPAYNGPPPPPAINLKFFGVATQDGKRRALLLSGEDVFLAYAGDVVDRRYRILTVTANAITVEDVPNKNKQTLPLVVN